MRTAPLRGTHGSALFTVLIVVLAIALLSTAILVGSQRHLANARLRETNVGLANCAMAVRQYVAAKVTGGGMATLDFTVPATKTPIKLQGGHYGNIQVSAFQLNPGPSFGAKPTSSVQNISNAMPMILGTSTTQQTGSAVCTDADGRTYEVEFSYVGG